MSTDRRDLGELADVAEDARDGFRHAAALLAESSRPELARLMRDLAIERDRFATDLRAISGEDERPSRATGHLTWMSVTDRAAVDPSTVIVSVLMGEDQAIAEYETVLTRATADDVRDLVQRQLDDIVATRSELKRLHGVRS